jgi:RecJ-like exonuclease
MNIKTKFSLGDRVFIIQKYNKEEWVPCESCKGKGGVIVEDNYFQCTDCRGSGGKTHWLPDKWKVSYKNTKIGKIAVEKYSEEYYEQNPQYRKLEVRYMVTATGIGSGTVWYELDVFKTLQEAEAECNRRNEEESKK